MRLLLWGMMVTVSPGYLSARLPGASRPHARLAESRLLSGAPAATVLAHLSAAMEAPCDTAAALDLYKKLLRLSRQSSDPSMSTALLRHVLDASERAEADEAIAHLVVNDLVQRQTPLSDPLAVLATFRERRLPLSVGSFDMIIQQAARRRDRASAYRAYRLLRRCHLLPSAFTLNALLNVEVRCGHPLVALSLLARAEQGAPRWPGSTPDAWSYSTAMSAAKNAKLYEAVGRLFTQQQRLARLRGARSVVAHNLAIEARLRLRDKAGARRLLQDMLDGERGAPRPQADTFNAMLSAVGAMGEPYAWVLQAMSSAEVAPDEYTICILLKLQPTLRSARSVWRWARRLETPTAAAHTSSFLAWEHFAECHLRKGRPDRVAPLLALMEARDGWRASDPRSHNLYLRALLAMERPQAALAHFERMCNATSPRGGGRDAGAAAGATPGATPAAEVSEGVGALRQRRGSLFSARRPPWLLREPPRPDAYSFSLALTALRRTEGAALGGEPDMTQGRTGTPAARAQRAAALLQSAVDRGLIDASQPAPPAVANALVCSCGADIALATALWKDHLRPMALAARQNTGAPAYASAGSPPTSEQAAYHALLRTCGLAGRADEALRIVYAMKRDGLPGDLACFNAYQRGKEAVDERDAEMSALRSVRVKAKGLLQAGYETLLKMELCPERVNGPKLGNIDTIRIVF